MIGQKTRPSFNEIRARKDRMKRDTRGGYKMETRDIAVMGKDSLFNHRTEIDKASFAANRLCRTIPFHDSFHVPWVRTRNCDFQTSFVLVEEGQDNVNNKLKVEVSMGKKIIELLFNGNAQLTR